MKVLRVNETVSVSARALQESAYAIIEAHHGPNPFTIPVSHLLRVERYRGFENAKNTTGQFSLRRFHSSARSPRLQVESYRQDATPRHTAVASVLPPHVPHTRSLSSHGGTPRPPPPRRPPPPPFRRPLTPRPVNSALAFQEDDALSSIPTTTSDELNRQSIVVREQDRKRQIQADKKHVWYKEAALREAELNLLHSTVQNLHADVRAHKMIAQAKVNYMYEKWQRKVIAMEKEVRKFVLELTAVRDEHKSNRVEARRQGKKDFKARQRLIRYAQRDIFWEADEIAAEVDTARRDLAELMYHLYWTEWNKKRTEFLADEAIKASHALKGETGTQSDSRRRTGEILDSYTTLVKLLDYLDESLMSGTQSMSRTQAENYVEIFAISQEIETFAANLAAEGHAWRTLDHHALIDSRYPQANYHTTVEIQARHIIDEAKSDSKALGVALRRAIRLPTIGLSTASAGSRLTIYAKMRHIYMGYNDLFVLSAEQYLGFLQNGLFMLNPAMKSESGRLKYAMMRPFYSYSASVLETRKTLRDSISMLESLYDRADSRNKRGPKFAATRPSKDRIWADSIMRKYEKEVIYYKETVRETLGNSTEALYRVLPRLSATNYPYLLKKYAQEAQHARTQLSQEEALVKLSTSVTLGDHTNPESLADLFAVIGKQELYPSGKPYPVELVSSQRAIAQALKELLLETVVGIDVFYRADVSRQGALISFATTEKVVVIDWRSWSKSKLTLLGMTQLLFTQLIEDANILKVIHNLDEVQSYFADRNMFPTNLVSLTPPQTTSDKGRLPRKVSTGTWKPPRHTVDNMLVMPFITDIAFLSLYNLQTFLRKAHPSMSVMSNLEPRTRANIMRAREKLLQSIATTEQDAGLELGPLKVDEEGHFHRLMMRFNTNLPGMNATLRIARVAAKMKVSHLARSADYRAGDDLAAYYMFTAMGQDLSSIEAMLSRGSVASDILCVVKQNDLTLHPKDREKLELAEKVKEEDLKHAQVDPKPEDASVNFKVMKPSSPSNFAAIRDTARGPLPELHPSLRDEYLRMQQMTNTSRKRKARRRLIFMAQQLSEAPHSSVPEGVISIEGSKGITTHTPFELVSKSEEIDAGALGTSTRKLRTLKHREKPTRQSKVQKSLRKPRRTLSLSTTNKQSTAIRTKQEGKTPAEALMPLPTIAPDRVENILKLSVRKTVGRRARLIVRRCSAEVGAKRIHLAQDNDEKKIEQQSVASPHEEKLEVDGQVKDILEDVRPVSFEKGESIPKEASNRDKGEVEWNTIAPTRKSETNKAANVFARIRTVLSEKNDTISEEPKSAEGGTSPPTTSSNPGEQVQKSGSKSTRTLPIRWIHHARPGRDEPKS